MKSYKTKYILSFDPSGNYSEGKGTTGWCLLNCETDTIVETGSISASEFTSMEGYWHSHLALMNTVFKEFEDVVIVIEDYLLYADKSQCQINSRFETPQLIGVLKYHCYSKKYPVQFQLASAVKTRWTDDILLKKGYLDKKDNRRNPMARNRITTCNGVRISRHAKDAIRHAVHFATFYNKC